ncbi:MAG: hypothetical protein HW391_1764 [Chloroflexi bacterium]|nr:hypothetical protein [Chloroflexota bacterium]
MTTPDPRELRIPVRVTARSGRDVIEGVRDGHLIVRVAAVPADGRANEASSWPSTAWIGRRS